MSFQAMAWAVRQKLPCTQKIVLVMLADRHNGDTGRCDPSHDRLAGDCGLTRRSVMDQLAKLDKAGFICTQHRVIDKLKTSNQYTLMLAFGTPADVKEFHIDVKQVPVVVNHVHQGSEPVAHKPVKEPVIEPKEKKAQAPAIPQSLLNDFLQVRKAKRVGPLTDTALAGIAREGAKAGLDLAATITVCCELGWASFNAGWYAERTAKKPPAAMTASNRNPHKYAGAAAAIFNMDDDSEVIDV